MPGHKVLFWMVPIIACRWLTRGSAGASVGSLAAVVTTMVLGGRLAGGLTMMPLVVVAGIFLDAGVMMVEKYRLSLPSAVALLALAGTIGNLVCLVKRVYEPSEYGMGMGNDFMSAWGSYAMFGCLAGAMGALCGYVIDRGRLTGK